MEMGTSSRNETNSVLAFPMFKEVREDREKVQGWREINGIGY